MDTKACNLTKGEIEELIRHHGAKLYEVSDDTIERINYLNKRLKAFGESEADKPKAEANLKSAEGFSAAQGWNNG